MSAFSTEKVIRSFIRKIYIPIIVLLVFCIPFLGFTEYAYADTSTNISDYQFTGDYVKNSDIFLTIVLPDGTEYQIKSTVYLDSSVNNGMLNLYFQPTDLRSYLGDMHLSNSDILSFLDGFYINLRVNESVNEYGVPNYTDTFELCYLPLSLFSSSTTVNNAAFFVAIGTDYYGYVISNIKNFAYPDFRNYKYYGSYDDVKNNYGDFAYYSYILQTLKYYINSAPLYFNEFNNSSNSLYIKSFTAQGFAHLDTEEYKLYKKTLENAISGGLTDTNNKLDDILNYGSGSFDDLEQDIGNASDKAEQGNQEIDDNAPKPDIDNTHDDTTDIIDSVLTEHGENVSNILGAILGSNIVNGMLLISISVGAIKYIFFGKG